MPCQSSRSQNGAITNTRLRGNENSTTNATGYHDDAVPTTDGEDMPSDAEFAALRDILPNDTGEGTMRGSPYGGEADSIVPEDATSVYLSDQEVILANALRYMQDLEGRNQRLRQENMTLGLMRIVYAWRIMTGIVS
jgi:hypothetical protein